MSKAEKIMDDIKLRQTNIQEDIDKLLTVTKEDSHVLLNEMATYDELLSGVKGYILINPAKNHEDNVYYFLHNDDINAPLKSQCAFYFTIKKDYLVIKENVSGLPVLSVKKRMAAFVWKNRDLIKTIWRKGSKIIPGSEAVRIYTEAVKVTSSESKKVRIDNNKWYYK